MPLSPKLLAALVDRRLIDRQRALDLAYACTAPHARTEALLAVLPLLEGEARRLVAADARHSFLAQPGRRWFVDRFVASCTPRELARLRRAARAIDGERDDDAFWIEWAIAARLRPASRRKAALAAMERALPRIRRRVLPLEPPREALAYITDDARGRAFGRALLEALDGYEYESAKTTLLSAIAAWLPPSLLTDALARIPHVWSLARPTILVALARNAPSNRMPEILAAAAALPDDGLCRSSALADLAWLTPRALAGAAMVVARTIADPNHRARALVALAHRLAKPDRIAVGREAIRMVRNEEYYVLGDVAAHAPTETLNEAIARVRQSPHERRPIALLRLARRAGAGRRRGALFEQAFREAAECGNEAVVEAFIDSVPVSHLDRGAGVASTLRNPHHAWRAYARLGSQASNMRERTALYREAVAAALRISNPRDEELREQAMCELARAVPPTMLAEMLEHDAELWDIDLRLRYLEILAERLPPEDHHAVLEHAEALGARSVLSWTATGLVRFASNERLLAACARGRTRGAG